ncbi:hypothetical protein [Gluconobacter japonicus]|uniref:Uncharacterized protein n=1 Tax=Gluconobacter japonicus TaxID=376620 RepID=A0ABQ5WIG5_GLUJA|nr:hypothetical protein [Gluconobacter japonicus]KXV28502.1 hypothetical protein AD938_04310 [Gluconobacter japonicus]GBR25572.1 hypothetical protein AA3271_2069 [Gluconobacter japonicus NBRC 3271]GLQ59961.1 hypothetical protein GCM10010937_17640 [Gluconobacter japonicus]
MSAAIEAGVRANEYLDVCAAKLTRSPVVAWLTQNYEKLLAATSRRTLSWAELARRLGEDGIFTGRGSSPKADAVRVEWYRVKRRIAAVREAQEAAKAAAERERLLALDAAREKKLHDDREAAALKARVEQADRAAAWQRQRAAADASYLQEAAAQLRSRQAAQGLPVSVPAPASGSPSGPENKPDLVMLDLPKFDPPYVSSRAYLPVDPSLPPVREGEICRATGIKWEYGDDLPGYPSKRNYEYERDWLRDVGRLLRAKHPTNITMTREERYVMRTAKSCIPNLF